MIQQPVYVVIDVSKASLDIAVRPISNKWRIDNREKGINRLVSRLNALSPALIKLEATGGIEMPVVAALGAAGLPVVVVNHRQVHDFTEAMSKLAKTDLLDAAVLALFAERVCPIPRPLPDAEALAKKLAITACMRELITMLNAMLRHHIPWNPLITQSLEPYS